MRLKTFFIALLICLVPSFVLATDYYVRPCDIDSECSYGSCDGTSYANAWEGFASCGGSEGTPINWTTVDSGDGKLFVAGTHTEQLSIGADGEDGTEIQVVSCTTANGASTDDAGKINGGDTVAYGVHSGTNEYVIIDGLEIYDTTTAGIMINNNSGGYWTVKNSTIRDIAGITQEAYRGIWVRCANNTIQNNTIYNIGGHGIQITTVTLAPNNNIVEENLVYNTNHTSMEAIIDSSSPYALSGTIFRYNKMYQSASHVSSGYDSAGIFLQGEGPSQDCGGCLHLGSAEIYGNVIDNINGSGIQLGINVSGPIKIYNNVITDSGAGSIEGQNVRIFTDDTVTVDMRNNIGAYGANSSYSNLLIDCATNSNLTIDYNNWYGGSGDIAWVDLNCDGDWGDANEKLSDWDDYQSYSGFDTNPTNDAGGSDPLFTDRATVPADLTLQSGSPVIDQGTCISSYTDYLASTTSWPSSVTTEDDEAIDGRCDIGAYRFPNWPGE